MSWSIGGKRVVVTGANSGIGKETAIALAREGARVVMVCRSRERGEAALADVRAASGRDDVELMLCDMASQRSIRSFCADFLATYDRLDVLVNNAGTTFPARELTEDGIERTFAVNHLGYFLITSLLLDRLAASAPARIISVASAGHRWGSLDPDNLQGERKYGELWAYGTSKLCNIAWTYELARRLEGTGVTANCVHPGAVGSNFGANAAPWFAALTRIGKPFLTSPEKGARTTVWLACAPELAGVTGGYFSRCKPARSSRASHDRDAARALWQISERLTAGA